MPQDDAQFINQLNPAWPTLLEQKVTWPGHYQAIKRSLKQTFSEIEGTVFTSQVELNLLVGKTQLFNGILASPVRRTYFQVPITSGLAQSFDVPEAEVGDLVRAVPSSVYPDWRTMVIRAAWVIQKGRIALFFFKVGTTDPNVSDTGLIDIILVRP